jgi:CBS-domain-containing membrane protein
MKVRKHMTARPITIPVDTDFKDAMGIMQKHRIRRLPVVDASGALAGIVAERDLVAAADRYLNSPVDVARIMTRQVFTIDEDAPVVNAAAMLIEHKIGGLPVIDASGLLLGIITETDLLKALTALIQGTKAKRGTTATREKAKAPARTTSKRKRAGTKAPQASRARAVSSTRKTRRPTSKSVPRRTGKR